MKHRVGLSLVVLLFSAAVARGATPVVDRTQVPTGILYDLTAQIAHLERFDGSAAAPAANSSVLRQAAFELRQASLTPAPRWPSDEILRDHGSLTVRIGLVDVLYNRITDAAKQSGAARVENGRLVLAPGAVEARRAFIAAPVRDYSYRGGDVAFVLDAALLVGESRPSHVEADFDDGAGYRPLAWGRTVHVHYVTPGRHVVNVRANDGVASFAFDVRALATPAPNDTIALTGTQSYNGSTATGRAFVYLSSQHTQLARPAVVLEGFDLDNTMNWDELYALLNQQNLIEDLRARGYDAVVLDFTDATDYIERNAFVAVDLLHKVQAAVDPATDFPLVGPSMGGLVARYALLWMEQNADAHRVRNLIEFDVPNRGANIPLGIQYWLNFFSGSSADAAHLLSRLDTPGAREMLLYHYTSPPGSTGAADPLRATFTGELTAMGNYPAQPRLVALSNGSGAMANQGFSAGAQIIQYQYNILLVNVRGNVWAVPNGNSTLIFDGINQQFFSGPTQKVTVSGTLPWDSAPGGTRDSMAQMDAVAPPVGDIIALYPNHCFIPTVSALDIDTNDPFYDVSGDADLLAHTPFDALYVPATNEPHVTVTPDNAPWLLNELDPVLSAVGPTRVRGPVFSLLGAAPNPFEYQTRVRWHLANTARVQVDVFDVSGRRVVSLLDATRAPGSGEVRWNGLDARGHAVAAGVYFARMRAAGETQSKRLVLVR